ncbi:glycosyltransferase [Tolypothrix sp. FACHB-123]|uniref:glycosyltransferase n=1 Tax=Tolypothrix sp. FACHB-123 TaxID=2692868 RepID=UPI0016833FD6|nr:glycosyltransferase [Tolypothrix sp. FACHB-123]MBD2359581.1 glycosyltransferase [Tolypothrix sp. FACHB-123]
MPNSFSVIVPAFNCENVIISTIKSIIQSIDFFQKNYIYAQQVHAEIIIVDDASTDNTVSVVREFIANNPLIKIITHTTNKGAGAARNTGVKNSQGEILFFCDADDIFLPEHIYVCYMLLKGTSEHISSFHLLSENYNLTITLPTQHFDVIRSQVKTKDKIHPYWQDAIEKSLPLNLCIRRYCHEFIEGFFEGEIHRQTKTEDCAYQALLEKFFVIGKTNLATVEYIRYSNNAFDKQLAKFQLPPGEAEEAYHIKPELLEQAYQIEAEHILYLQRQQYLQKCISQGYQFTQDWFSIHIPIWEQLLKNFVNLPNLRFLEIGSWEGRSTCWLLDNILTHESAKITCIDTFVGSMEHQNLDVSSLQSLSKRFDFNIAQTGSSHKVEKIVGISQEVLRTLPIDTYDFLYIDGSHIAADVLEDAVLGWRLVKSQGIIIFDDYNWPKFTDNLTQHPKLAIDAFLRVFSEKIQVIYQGYQVIVQKKNGSLVLVMLN